MTGHEREDGAGQAADAVDRLIDEAVAASLDSLARPVELREKVLARLEHHPEQEDHGWRLRALVLRPALLPALGALLLVAGVATLWERADRQLSTSSSPGAIARRAPAVERPDARETVRTQPPAVARDDARPPEPRRSSPAGPRPASQATRVFAAASLLDMDAAASPVPTLSADSDASASLPGAPAGNLGDPISPMPRPRPISIDPLATPPIEMAPPISTLGKPVSTLADEAGRDPLDPGKPGGL